MYPLFGRVLLSTVGSHQHRCLFEVSSRLIHVSNEPVLSTKKYKESLKKRAEEEKARQDSLLREYGLLEQTFGTGFDSQHPETPKFANQYEVVKGKIYDCKPWKMTVKPGKIYSWCSCGQSHTQPLCDGMHYRIETTSNLKVQNRFRPIKFEVMEECEVWLCNCKQTDSWPFCDGTHRRSDIQKEIELRDAPAVRVHPK